MSAALPAFAMLGCSDANAEVEARDAPADAAVGETGGPSSDDASTSATCPGASHFPSNADAPPVTDLECIGRSSRETTACSELTFGGTLHKFLSTDPLKNVALEVVDAQGNTLARGTSPDGGAVFVRVPVRPEGFFGKLILTADGVWPHDVFELSRPITTDPGFFDGATLDDALAAQLATLFGLPAQDPTRTGLVVVRAVDCNGRLIEGVTVELDAASDATLYMGPTGLPDLALSGTTPYGGAAFPGVAPGPVRATVRKPAADGSPGEVVAAGTGASRAGAVVGLWAHAQ